MSGIAALVKSVRPELLGEDIENIINITATHPAPNYRDNFVGYGLVTAAGAVGFVNPSYIAVAQHTIGKNGTVGTLADVESLQVSQAFSNVPSLFGNRLYTCWRHKLRGTANYNAGFVSTIYMWTRASGTFGWRDTTAGDTIIDYNDEVRSGRVASAVGQHSTTFETSVYRVVDPVSGNGVWFPCPPADAVIAFTAVGPASPVGLNGPSPEPQLRLTTYPNPAYRRVMIDLELPAAGVVRSAVLDAQGRRVAEIYNGLLEGGIHRFEWNCRSGAHGLLSPGIYYLQMYYGGRLLSRRLVLLGARH